MSRKLAMPSTKIKGGEGMPGSAEVETEGAAIFGDGGILAL